MSSQVVFITGTSSGFGYNFAQYCLDQGSKVIATSRNQSKLSFKSATADNFLAVHCDTSQQESVENAFHQALSHFNRIDIVLNNAGYGLSGEFEALSEKQIRAQMEPNFYGVVNVTRKALEVMRENNKPQGGRILQVTSMAGQAGMPTFSIYCASKWAVEGFTEAVSKEVKAEWNIRFTCVEPGGFRTNWAGGAMEFAEERHPAYDHIDAKKHMSERHGTQNGDPEKAAAAFWEIATMQDPPLRIAMGSDCYDIVMNKVKEYSETYPKYRDLTRSTDIE